MSGILAIDVLGTVIVRDGDRELLGLPRKTRALLGYLAVYRGDPIPRDSLAELLWPDRPTDLARQGVRNALMSLRKALGQRWSEHFATTGEFIQLNGAYVDLGEFEQLARSCERDDLRQAIDLYRGEFFLDLSTIRSEPLTNWLTVERERIGAVICNVLRQLTAAHDRAGAYEEAVVSARKLVALEPLSEPDHRVLMLALAHAGRRPEALHHYDELAERLSRELGTGPDSETNALALAIERSSVSALMVDESAGHSGSSQRPRVSPAAKSTRPHWPYLMPKLTLGLLPLQSLGGQPKNGDLAERVCDDLITDLIEHSHGVSIASIADRRLMTSLVPVARPDVDYVLSAAIHFRQTRTVRLNVRVLDTETGLYRWGRRYDGDITSDHLWLTEKIARDVHFLMVREASRRAIMSPLEGIGPEHFLSRATAAFGRRSTASATSEAQKWLLAAVAADPANTSALTGLARTCQHIVSQAGWADLTVSKAAYDLGLAAAGAAVDLVPEDDEANCFLGMLHSASGDIDAAQEAFDRALAGNPRFAPAHAFRGYNAAFRGEAHSTLQSIETALRMGGGERRQAIWWFFAGFAQLLLGNGSNALSLFRKSLECNPEYGSAQLFLTVALRQTGNSRDSLRAFTEFRTRFPQYEVAAFRQQWVARSQSQVYRSQIDPLFGHLRDVIAAH